MNQKIFYQYDGNLNILFKVHNGPISIDDIHSSWDYAIENKLIPKETIGFISDFREANFDFNLREYHKLIDFFKQNTEIFKNRKLAAVTQRPKDVVIPTSIANSDDGHFCKPFFTLEAAINWVIR